MRHRKKKILRLFLLMLLVLPIFIAVFGQAVLYLWNHLMPQIFGLPSLTFWQAIGILVLSRILFGGRGFSSGSRMSHRMRERWERMTPEQRAEARQRMGSCFDWRPEEPEPGPGAEARP